MSPEQSRFADAISVRGLTKRYGSAPVLHGIDLRVAPGEVLALFEPNGAGKTTIVQIPLKWMAQRVRSVFLPDSCTAVEPAGSWEHGRTALVLALRRGAGLVLSLLTVRWRDQPH